MCVCVCVAFVRLSNNSNDMAEKNIFLSDALKCFLNTIITFEYKQECLSQSTISVLV